MAIFSILCLWDEKKYPDLGTGAKTTKNRITFLFQNLKVWEKQVSLFYCFLAPIQRYGHVIEIMSMGQFQKEI